MDLYLRIVTELTDQQQESVDTLLNPWVDESQGKIGRDPSMPNRLLTRASRSQHLKIPINFLYQLARQQKIDFELGIAESDQFEAICYFGHEEGRPDIFEMALYLGL
jgi:hypothetical protein